MSNEKYYCLDQYEEMKERHYDALAEQIELELTNPHLTPDEYWALRDELMNLKR